MSSKQHVSDPSSSKPPKGLSKSGSPKPSKSSKPIESLSGVGFLFGYKCAAHRYQQRFSFRKLQVELNVHIQDFPNVLDSLKSRQWLSTLSDNPLPCQNLVREFYANMESSLVDVNHPNRFSVFCRGCRVPFAPSVIRTILNLPLVKSPEFNETYQPDLATIGKELTGQDTFVWNTASNDFPTTSLTSFYRVIHKISLSNWFPNSHASSVTVDIGRFIYAVGTGVSIDLGTVIFDKIINAFQSKGKRLFLPFPCLIHRIAVSNHIKLTSQDVFVSVSKLDKNYQPKSSNPVPPPPTHPYPLLRDLDPSSWKFKLFEHLYVHQHKLEDLQVQVDRFVKRHNESQRLVLAQLAQLRQLFQSAASNSAAPPPTSADGHLEGAISEESDKDAAQSQGESSSSDASDPAPLPPRALMKGRKTISMCPLSSPGQ